MKRSIILAVALAFTLSLPTTVCTRPARGQEAVCHLLVFADTSDLELKESVQIDAANILNVFAQNVPQARLKTIVRQDPNLSASQMLNSIRGCELRRGVDTLVVFYAGHGAHSRQRGHYLRPNRQAVYRDDVRRAMESTGSRLNILITDACSIAIKIHADRAYSKQRLIVTETSPAFSSLCWQPSGFVDINSSSRGEVAVGDNLDGGYFTSGLCGYLRAQAQRRISWNDVLQNVRRDVDRNFRDKHPSGVTRNIAGQPPRQTTQTVSGRLQLDQAGGQARVQAGGQAALVIQRIFRGSSAAALRSGTGQVVQLEPGDRLLAINGQRLRDHNDFQQVLQSMPRGAQFTLTIINRRDGQALDLSGRLDRGGGYRLGLQVKTIR